MEQKQFNDIIKRLECVCVKTDFDNPYKKAEYANVLIDLDYELMDNAIDHFILHGIQTSNGINRSFLPAPGELLDIYNELKKIQNYNNNLSNNEFCHVCENHGYILHDKKIDYLSDNKKKYISQMTLYCTECEKGTEFKYDGKQSKVKSLNYSEPISKYYDVEQLKAANMFKKRGPCECPDAERAQIIKTLGPNVFRILNGGGVKSA